MKKLELFYLESCPYCKRARGYIQEFLDEDPKYKKIEIELIEESKNKKVADSRDYYYVPTFYLDGKKIHEGAATKDDIKKVLEAVLSDTQTMN